MMRDHPPCVYGNANKYPRIFEANREVIKDANLIFPGQKIRIPPE
jgi:nucleoid-associated protein YgaU